jgi:ABC-type glycerol-3-phosphate transport system substrate-binding protein
MTVFRPRSLGRRNRGSAALTGRSARSRRLGRNVTAVVGACVLLASLSAVATGASGASTRTSDGLSGTITMNVSTCCSVQIIAQVSKAFRKLHPGVHFKIANVPNDQTYVPLLQTERLAGTEPMIDETYDVLTPTLEVDGLVGDLTSDLKAGKPYHKNYWYSGFLSSYIPPKGAPFGVGHVFALPAGADATVVMYNKNEFEKAGVPFPKDGWTWKQMLSDAAKLRIGHGSSQRQFGICLRPDWQALYNPILKAYGATSFNETKATLDTPAALAAWKLLISPLENGDSVGEAAQQAKNGGSGCEPFFESGEAAMSMEVRANLPGIISAVGNKFKYNAVPMPSITGANGKKVIPTGGGSLGWALAPNAVHNPLALAFLKYYFSAPGQAVAEATLGEVPAEPSLNGPHALWRTESGGPANTSAYTIAAATATIAPQTPGNVFTLSNIDVPNAVLAVTIGHQSIKTAFTNLQNEMDTAYSQAG